MEKMSGSVTTEGISRRERERLISSSSRLSPTAPRARSELAENSIDSLELGSRAFYTYLKK